MKQLLFLFLIVILASTFTYSVPVIHARGGCEGTGILSGTITFVDLVFDTIVFVPRLVFRSLAGHGDGHGYRSRRNRHHYSHDSFSYRDGYTEKGRSGRKGKGRR